jgi:dienelactone hydrolase
MSDDQGQATSSHHLASAHPQPRGYDPFVRGPAPVGVRTLELRSAGENHTTELWYPAAARYRGRDLDAATCDAFTILPGSPSARQHAVRDAVFAAGSRRLVMYFHGAYGHRREAAHVCTHLASHGYVVAALDFPGDNVNDTVPKDDGAPATLAHTPIDDSARNRPRQASAALDALRETAPRLGLDLRTDRVGCFGNSMGGNTSLAVNSLDGRFAASFAMCPFYGTRGLVRAADRLQDILRVDDWGRPVPVLILAGELDPFVALPDMRELHGRLRAPKRIAVLQRAGHLHFVDNATAVHEGLRTWYLSGTFPDPDLDAAAVANAMRPFTELCSEMDGATTARALCLAHMDAELERDAAAGAFLAGDLAAQFAERGIALEAA